MHQTRQEVTRKIPIPRKGNKYVARALSHVQNSVPVVIALRDILKLARTAREVKQMISEKMLKINGRDVEDLNESIKLFNIFEADKKYVLILLPTGRFSFQESKDNERLCKVVSRTLVSKNKIQLNLHDGSNSLGSKDIVVGDSVYLDMKGKIKSHSKFEKGKEGLIISGSYIGLSGKIESIHENHVKMKVGKEEKELLKSSIIVK